MKEFLDYSARDMEDLYIIEAAIKEWGNDKLLGHKGQLSKFKQQRRKIEKDELEVEKAEEAAAFADSNIADFTAEILKDDVYHIATTGNFIYYRESSKSWKTVATGPYFDNRAIGKKLRDLYFECIVTAGRAKDDVVYSFDPKLPNSTLNLMDKAKNEWLEPEDGDVNPWISLLIKSVSNGDQAIVDHIEQVVAWKYLHPEDYQLCALVFFGPGGAGKNEFVTKVLGGIFTSPQVLVCTYNDAFGNFSGERLGKTVVMVDEASADKAKTDQLKSIVGNENIFLNAKFGKQGAVANTPMYVIAGNDRTGSLLLDGSAADRRWSIIRQEKDAYDRTKEEFNVATKEEAGEMYKANAHIALDDPKEIAKWLGHIIVKWGNKTTRPDPIHGEVYDQTIVNQQAPHYDFATKVFSHSEFNFISNDTFYAGYKKYLAVNHPSHKPAQIKNVIADIDHWLPKKDFRVSKKLRANIRVIENDKLLMRVGFKSDTNQGSIIGCDVQYYSVDKYENPSFDLTTIEELAEHKTVSVTVLAAKMEKM